MRPEKNKSQVAIFLILGLVMIIAVVSIALLGRYAAKKVSTQETTDIKETSFDVQPIRKFVEECLSVTSKSGLKQLGKQGGYIFKSQGGLLLDYQKTDEGLFFINNENSKVVYNILKPRFSFGNTNPNPPNYPWKTFPYTDETKTEKEFLAKGAFGSNNMPPLNKSFGQNSIQEQLIIYVTNNIDSCLDFSVFEEQGFAITKANKKTYVDVNENDIVFRLSYGINIENLVSGEKTLINTFLVRQNIRLGKLHAFANRLIESDISDIKFNIANKTGVDSFVVDIRKNAYNNDDLVIITDEQSSLDGAPYKYIFARKNRNPALFYLTPEEISLPTLDEEGEFTKITREVLLQEQGLKALDPDEDVITNTSFTIEPELPITLLLARTDFRIKVSDGNLEDYQTITVIRK